MNVSAGSQRTLPRALVLALLVGGSGGLLAHGHQARADTGDAPGHQRVDLDSEPAADAEPLPLADIVRDPLPAVPPGSRRVPPPAPALLPAAGSLRVPALRVPTLLPVAVPGVASVSAVGSPAAAAPAARAAAVAGSQAGSGRHAARSRPADTGRSAQRHSGRHRAHSPHSHRRDLPVPPHATGELNWTELARCEAGGNPHAVDPSGRYGGLYQFDSGTWRSLGGRGLPQDATASEQTDRARELYQRRGIAPWPACGPRAAG